tara:strand:+ start:979 stop:1368 length:390 start_codon:yes stop_codon:yes gene_type:complete
MTIELWLMLALVLSLGFNGVLIWFSREQSRQLSYISQNIGDLIEILSSYREHLSKVYSLEMFYGDETLKFLMEHTNALVMLIQTEYGEVTYLTEPLDTIIGEEEEIEKESEENEQEQDVFYAGSRRRDS